jgi:hypothetical protein
MRSRRRGGTFDTSRASAGLGPGHYKAGSDRATFVVLYFVHWVHRGSTDAGVHRRHNGHIGWLEACLEVLQPNLSPNETILCLSAFNGSCRSDRPASPHSEGGIP